MQLISILTALGMSSLMLPRSMRVDHVGPRTGMWDEIQPPRCRILTFLQAEINRELFDPFQPSSLIGALLLSILYSNNPKIPESNYIAFPSLLLCPIRSTRSKYVVSQMNFAAAILLLVLWCHSFQL